MRRKTANRNVFKLRLLTIFGLPGSKVLPHIMEKLRKSKKKKTFKVCLLKMLDRQLKKKLRKPYKIV